MHVNKRVTRVQRVTESNGMVKIKYPGPHPHPTPPPPPPGRFKPHWDITIPCWNAPQNTTQRIRECVRFCTFVPDLYMQIGASAGSGQYSKRANAKISLSWQVSPIFWLSIALHYRPAWLNILPVFPKYEVDWRSWIDIARIFQFFLLCHRHVG